MTCPTCQHAEKVRPATNPITRALAWYERVVWRLRPACPATIGSEHTSSGHPEPCACSDLFHVAAT